MSRRLAAVGPEGSSVTRRWRVGRVIHLKVWGGVGEALAAGSFMGG